MSLYVDLLNRRCASCVSSDPERLKILAVIGTGAKRMSDMLSSLLLYSRATSDDDSRESIDSGEVVRGVITLLQRNIENTGAIIGARDLPRVCAWRGGLDQVSRISSKTR